MDAVTAAVLADAAFDAVGEATKFSTRRYREKIEQLRQTGELTPGKQSRAMESKERSPAFWMAEAARTQASAETMKNPLAKTGMEHIAECYESFAKRAEKQPRQGRAVQRGAQPMDTVVSGSRVRPKG